jgi:hypothetical protein
VNSFFVLRLASVGQFARCSGDAGLFQEQLERVLQYLGLSMTVNQVVNHNVGRQDHQTRVDPDADKGRPPVEQALQAHPLRQL